MLSFLARAAVAAAARPLRSPVCSPLWSGAAAATAARALLASPPLPAVLPLAGLKTKTSLKKRCKDCFIVRRRGRLYVCCKTNPRHKQRKL
ncbi:39S ribosomal protein L36, mitochondrial [Nothoprocta perdicaria]|uniref:Ribosomal protein n=1 Tax=Nothoprocta perdicaria TaxID=30464 RepID=A0A8C6ZX73_NOTPE|nr:39S ribosomal protein L36, mitochondrial [Nothoprocta perdicaria]